MGYELTFTAELCGVENTYMDGMSCDLKIEELCDDGSDIAGYKISMNYLLDT